MNSGAYAEVMLLRILLLITISKQCIGDITWVQGNNGESHSAACSRMNFFPSNRNVPMQWEVSVITNIIKKKFSSFTLINSPVKGCCVSSLWCSVSNKTCFTQSYGSYFENYGTLNDDTDLLPVFTCNEQLSAPGITPWLSTVSVDGSQVTYSGDYFGNNEKDMLLHLAGESCENPEICSKVCRPCSSTNKCPVDSECLNTADYPACFMFCAGPQDQSCPCGSFCETVTS